MNYGKKEKILILYGNYGDGHLQTANAIQEAIRLQYNDVEAVVLDMMEWTHPYIHPISRYVFIQGVRKFPSVYGYLFQKTREVKSSVMIKLFNLLSIRRMLELLKEIHPSIVVSTFPLAAAMMSTLKINSLANVPTVTVITDHTDHSCWIHPCTSHYIVGSDRVRQVLKRTGIPDSQISVTGIPIKPVFSQAYSRDMLKAKHGLDCGLPTVLVMGGGYGLIGDGLSSILALNTLSQKIQLIVVCGHNEKLKQQLSKSLKYSKHRILLTGYIDYVHELMAVSDIMITKPGGLTTSEAIALELPMLLYKPIPGQEQDNAQFLLHAGVAMQADQTSDLIVKLSEVLKNPLILLDMKEKARQIQTKKAAFDASEVILNTIEKSMNR